MDYWAPTAHQTQVASPRYGAPAATEQAPQPSVGRVVALAFLILATVPVTLIGMAITFPPLLIPAALIGVGLAVPQRSKLRAAFFVLAAVADVVFYVLVGLFIYALSHMQF